MPGAKANMQLPGTLHQLGRFATVGVINTTVAVSIQFLCHRFGNLSVEQGGYVGYGLAIAVSYMLNRNWTFASKTGHVRTLLPFIAQSLASALIYAKLSGYLATSLPYALAIGIGVTVIFALNFILGRLIFAPVKDDQAARQLRP